MIQRVESSPIPLSDTMTVAWATPFFTSTGDRTTTAPIEDIEVCPRVLLAVVRRVPHKAVRTDDFPGFFFHQSISIADIRTHSRCA